MLDETFAEAVAHKPGGHVVLGQRLRPFSFWHAANLDFIQSPFAGHPGPLDFSALYLAAKSCQLKYPATIATAGRARLKRLCGSHRADLFLTTLRYGRKFQSKPEFRLHEISKFSAYLADYMTCGPIIASKEGSKPVKVPWYLYYAAMLVKHAGYTKAQAWDAPVAESQWWITATMIAGGTEVDLMSAEDRETLRAIGYTDV